MNNNKEKEKKKLDECHFKVPLKLTLDEEGNKVPSFKEVDYKDLCFKIITHEFDTAQEAISVSQLMSTRNRQALLLAKGYNKDGDIITMIRICDHGSVKVNTNI